jgi:hypothetical protein
MRQRRLSKRILSNHIPTMTTHKRIAILLALAAHREDPQRSTLSARRRRYRRHGGGAPAAALTDPANTTYVSDTFTRADGKIGTAETGGAWQDLTGNWRVLSNRARANNAAARRHATIDSATGAGTFVQAADGKWRVTIAIAGSSGLGIRWTDANNCLYLCASSVDTTLYRITAGVLTAIGSTDGTPNGSQIRIDATGSAIDVYIDGVLQYSVVETQGQTVTRHGLITDDISSRLDNYSHKNA